MDNVSRPGSAEDGICIEDRRLRVAGKASRLRAALNKDTMREPFVKISQAEDSEPDEGRQALECVTVLPALANRGSSSSCPAKATGCGGLRRIACRHAGWRPEEARG
jgi:hypothetical protein